MTCERPLLVRNIEIDNENVTTKNTLWDDKRLIEPCTVGLLKLISLLTRLLILFWSKNRARPTILMSSEYGSNNGFKFNEKISK